MRRVLLAMALGLASTLLVAQSQDVTLSRQQAPAPFAGMLDEHPVIQYAQRPTRDPVARLNRALADGSASLTFHTKTGYLQPVLDALGVAVESQLLVFSKTGVQRAHTSPDNPRAIYFNDAVVVGYIPGARFLELAAHDPEQGVVFYTIDQAAATAPTLRRRTQCLTCHVSSSTLDVPGMINRSTFARDDGAVISPLGSHTVDHRTRLLDRWGGMFVTGNYTQFPYNVAVHKGNVTTSANDPTGATTSSEIFIRWINSAPETRGYPSAESDIAAMLLFDHQMHAINLLTRVNWEARVAAAGGRVELATGPLRDLVDELADYLLFVDEVPPPARITPRAGLAERFGASGPKDRQGRSLRQLNLETRLLLYSCSYMVYSESFDNLPASIKNAVYQRMWTILSGADSRPKYAHLSADLRRAIVEILGDTKKDLPELFQAGSRR